VSIPPDDSFLTFLAYLTEGAGVDEALVIGQAVDLEPLGELEQVTAQAYEAEDSKAQVEPRLSLDEVLLPVVFLLRSRGLVHLERRTPVIEPT